MAAKTTAVARVGQSIQIATPADLYSVAEMLYRGGLCPPGIDNPNKVAAVILAGMEVGLAPTQALGSIMLTNGRLSIYGDGALALVRASGLLESIAEAVEGEGGGRLGRCVVKRKGEPERSFQFTMAEAERAGLIERARGKDGKGRGPWVSYPDRMLAMRARGFALRDVFPDVLRGLVTYEEAQDYETVQATVISATPAGSPTPAPQLPAAAPAPTVPPAPPAAGVVTADQLTQIALIRQGYLAGLGGKGPLDADQQRLAWAELLANYGVASAKAFTSEQAQAFITAEGPKYDPFTHGTASGSSPT